MKMPIPMTVRSSLFDHEQVERVFMPAGMTIAEMIVEQLPPADFRRVYPFLKVYLGNDPAPIERRFWHRIKPKAGNEMLVIPVPQGGGGGGGGKVLRSVLMVAVIAASFAIPGSTLLAGTAFASGTFGGALLSAGIGLVGSLLVNALVPVQPPELPQAEEARSKQFSLEGASNQISPWGVVPRVLGRHKMVPPLAAKPYQERIGDDQFLRLAVCWGYGPVTLEDLKIAGTAATQLPDVEIEHCLAPGDGDPALKLFPRIVVEDRVQRELTKAASWVTQTTGREITEFLFEVTCPLGLKRTSSNGKNVDARTVDLEYQYRLVGTSTWTGPIAFQASGNTINPVYITKRQKVTKGQYQVQIRRVSNDQPEADKQRIQDETHLTLFQSFEAADPIDVQGVARSAFRIKASEFANGQIEISAIVISRGRHFDVATDVWITNQPLTSPADLFRLVCQDAYANPDPKINNELDFPSIEEWARTCFNKKWTFNGVIDFADSEEGVLGKLCTAGRAVFRRLGRQYSVVEDKKNKVPIQLFTPRNVRDLRISKQFIRAPHALRIRYVNQDKDFEQDEHIVYDDGFNRGNATVFETTEIFGITTQKLVQTHGRYMIAVGRLRPERIEFTTDWEYLAAPLGSLIELQHDVPLYGVGSGRVLARTVVGTQCLGMVIDERLVFDGSNHEVRIRRSTDGSQVVFPIADFNGETNQINFSPPLQEASGHYPQVGDLVAVGKRGIGTRSLIVREIQPSDELSARIVCVDFAVGVFTPDDEIGDFDPEINVPIPLVEGEIPALPIPIVSRIRSDESVLILKRDGTASPRIAISLQAPRFFIGNLYGVRMGYRGSDAPGNAYTLQTYDPETRVIFIDQVGTGFAYDILLKYVFRDRRGKLVAGPWVGPIRHVVVGATSNPPDVVGFYQDGAFLRWKADDIAADHAGWKMRVAFSDDVPWEGCTDVHDGLISQEFWPVNSLPDGALYAKLKAVDRSGKESKSPKVLKISQSDEPEYVVILAEDRSKQNFPGKIVGGTVGVDEFGVLGIEATGTALYGPDPKEKYGPNPNQIYGDDTYNALTYETFYRFPGTGLKSTDRLDLELAISPGARIEARWSSDQVFPPLGSQPLYGINPAKTDVLYGTTVPYALLWSAAAEESERPWVSWRGSIRAVPGEILRLRISAPGGDVQGLVRRMRIKLVALEETETIDDLLIGLSGTRAKPTKTFRRLTWSNAILQSPTGKAAFARRIRKDNVLDAKQGPVWMVVDTSSNDPTTGILDVTLGGY